MYPLAQFPFSPMAHDELAYGAIYVNNKCSGTGFVLNETGQVCTCSHVVTNKGKPLSLKDVIWFCSSDGKYSDSYELKLLWNSPDYDLALLSSEKILCQHPVQLADTFSVQFEQTIYYVGFDEHEGVPFGHIDWVKLPPLNQLSKGIKKHTSFISSIGKCRFIGSGKDADFFDYFGECIPNYSGGCVLNGEGKAIAVNCTSWEPLKKDIQNINRNIIRAVSLEHLQQFN